MNVELLCRQYDNEEVHTRHVTKLALQLFDATRVRLRLALADRKFLEAAARLHDLGYSTDPRRHREVGAEIVEREYATPSRFLVAATMLFHAGDLAANRQHPLVAESHDPKRAARLGAFLRIADGLDFGHIQDASIVSIHCGPRKVRVVVRAPFFPINLIRARQKSDLWNAEFPVPIEIVPAPPLKQPPSLLLPELNALEAARRLIHRQFKIITINVDGALRATDSEPLHQIRVAVRRLRAVLRAFEKPLASTSATQIDRSLQRLNRVLGPARDLDVWLTLLTSDTIQNQLPANRRLTALVRHQLENRKLQQPTVRRYLSGSSYNALRLKIGRLARTELPRLQMTGAGATLTKLARRNFGRSLRRAIHLADLRHSESPEELHELRQALRRARYQGEFFAAVFGPPFPDLTKRIHAVEQTLAGIHDADVALARLNNEGPPPPRLLVQELQRRRVDEQSQLEARWKRLDKLVTERVVRRKLKL